MLPLEPYPEEPEDHICPLCSEPITRSGLKILGEKLGRDEMLPIIKQIKVRENDTPLRRIAKAFDP